MQGYIQGYIQGYMQGKIHCGIQGYIQGMEGEEVRRKGDSRYSYKDDCLILEGNVAVVCKVDEIDHGAWVQDRISERSAFVDFKPKAQ